jgi:hypothetical protein
MRETYRVQKVAQSLIVLDAQDQHADAAFQEPNVRKQQELCQPCQEVDIFVILLRNIPSMSAISTLDGYDLNCRSRYCKQTADYNDIVILPTVRTHDEPRSEMNIPSQERGDRTLPRFSG